MKLYKFKPLVWTGVAANCGNIGIEYTIGVASVEAGTFRLHERYNGLNTSGWGPISTHSTIQEAKDAAQEHHEKRLSKYLELVKGKA